MEPGYAQPGDTVAVPGFAGQVWRVVQVARMPEQEVECENSRGTRLWVAPRNLARVAGPFQVHNPAAITRVSTGDRLIATAPGQSFETGRVYTVVAVYDGKMDLECAALDLTVAGVQIDDPSLQPYAEVV